MFILVLMMGANGIMRVNEWLQYMTCSNFLTQNL